MSSPRKTAQLIAVLEAFLADPAGVHYGYPLMKATGLQSGTLYPALARLEAQGWLTSFWDETEKPGARRRNYQLTALGAQEARLLLAEHRLSAAVSTAVVAKPAFGGW